jgi:hypothetical protein
LLFNAYSAGLFGPSSFLSPKPVRFSAVVARSCFLFCLLFFATFNTSKNSFCESLHFHAMSNQKINIAKSHFLWRISSSFVKQEGRIKGRENLYEEDNIEEVLRMKKNFTEKDELLSMLADIYVQLEELDNVLETSFSEERKSLNDGMIKKINSSKQQISFLDDKLTIRRGIYANRKEMLLASL